MQSSVKRIEHTSTWLTDDMDGSGERAGVLTGAEPCPVKADGRIEIDNRK